MDNSEPRLYRNKFADAVGPGPTRQGKEICRCLPVSKGKQSTEVFFHDEPQDASAPGWLRLLELIDEAASDGRPEFKPLVELSPEERRQVVTLPPTIAKLTQVEHFVLYGSNVVRLPPEIGAMASLRKFSPYTSHRLHWFPYELTRCRKLKSSTVSTRAIYGNFKYRPPFPRLRPAGPPTNGDPGTWGAEVIEKCSVCDGPVTEVHQVWISLRIATDVLPLLVNACSPACVKALPAPADGYVKHPHTGGSGIAQPDPHWM